MPLRDHFRPPLDNLRHWEGLYGGWPMMIVASLRDKLPKGYFAQPRVHLAEGAYEFKVYDGKVHSVLVAAVQLVAPANKDRPEKRRTFVAKCAGLLKERVSVVIVDLVTTTTGNLCSELLDLIGHRDVNCKMDLYASACRTTRKNGRRLLETWYEPLTLGQPLPTMPLWLADDVAVPLELERATKKAAASWASHETGFIPPCG